MESKNNIAKLNNCYGCGVCVRACPVNIISLKENDEGFYQPIIDNQDKCIECGRCLKVCSFNHNEVDQVLSYQPNAYAVWSNNEYVRQRCSSGGVGFEIGKYLIDKGYKGVGVRYNAVTNRAEHFVASTVEEFAATVGSKYIPSFTAEAFKTIDPSQKYLITGTPCQIDSFRRFVKMMNKEDNFILLDFFCHGVPSLLLWDKYLEDVEGKLGKTTFISWRNKKNGWSDSYSIEADSISDSLDYKFSYNLDEPDRSHIYSSRMSKGDNFFMFFLNNYCLNKCCYTTCKYKMLNSAADIRIGDLWGDLYKQDNKGVSVVLAMTSKGKSVINDLKASCTIISHSVTEACQGQMRQNANEPPIRCKVIRALHGPRSLDDIKKTIIEPYRRRFLLGRIGNKLLRALNLKPIFRTR